ncbi:MAG: hypothetical protein U0892_08905 [Pirellulales bacterium]
MVVKLDRERKLELVLAEMQRRHDEGYARGVHDEDATAIIDFLFACRSQLGVLCSTSPSVRERTGFVWRMLVPKETAKQIEAWIAGVFFIAGMYPQSVKDGVSS